jgi:SAM-dependent methyltransferase
VTDHLERVQRSYDRVAAEYARRIDGELAHKPFDRDLLDRFAAAMPAGGLVADVGCGPGHVGGYLHERGVQVIGIDPSEAMLAEARRLWPAIEFRPGALPALDLVDGSLAGAVAFYSIIHLPRAALPAAFADLRRVLAGGGLLLLGFHAGDEDLHLDEWWGEPVSLDSHFHQPATVAALLPPAGFAVLERHERDPYPEVEYPSRRAYLLARAI